MKKYNLVDRQTLVSLIKSCNGLSKVYIEGATNDKVSDYIFVIKPETHINNKNKQVTNIQSNILQISQRYVNDDRETVLNTLFKSCDVAIDDSSIRQTDNLRFLAIINHKSKSYVVGCRYTGKYNSSDDNEIAVANAIPSNLYDVKWTGRNTKKSDVLVTRKDDNKSAFIEVKSNYSDNLANPRVYFRGEVGNLVTGEWHCDYATQIKQHVLELLNSSSQAKDFINSLDNYLIKVYPKGAAIQFGASSKRNGDFIKLSFKTVSDFASTRSSLYVVNRTHVDISPILKSHYEGKAQYIQLGNNLFAFSDVLDWRVPELPSINGTESVRLSIQSTATRDRYEIMYSLVATENPESEYSITSDKKKKPWVKPE